MIQVSNPQGDLIAWSPQADTLAFIASTQGSSWNVGELDIVSAPLFKNPERLTNQVAGELTWSPDEISIAYLGLRHSDDLYTIGLAYMDDRPSKDLFPGEVARTDGFSSKKAILEWMDENRLKILTSCGVDCMQGLDFNISTSISTPTGDPIQRIWDMWSPDTNLPAKTPPAFSDLVGQLNWSPDEKLIAYIDENANTWIIDVDEGSLYPLDIGQYGTATETDWSYDGLYLAVHVDQKLKIFSFDCP
jgi:hypothetical protein